MMKKFAMAMAVMMMSVCVITGCSDKNSADTSAQSSAEAQQSTTDPNALAAAEQSSTEQSSSALATEQSSVGQNSEETENSQQSSTETDVSKEKTVTGVVEEINEFMFVINDNNQSSYLFAFEEKPEGLDSVSVGDTVTVTYTGTVSEVDPFTGEVILVEKQ